VSTRTEHIFQISYVRKSFIDFENSRIQRYIKVYLLKNIDFLNIYKFLMIVGSNKSHDLKF